MTMRRKQKFKKKSPVNVLHAACEWMNNKSTKCSAGYYTSNATQAYFYYLKFVTLLFN